MADDGAERTYHWDRGGESSACGVALGEHTWWSSALAGVTCAECLDIADRLIQELSAEVERLRGDLADTDETYQRKTASLVYEMSASYEARTAERDAAQAQAEAAEGRARVEGRVEGLRHAARVAYAAAHDARERGWHTDYKAYVGIADVINTDAYEEAEKLSALGAVQAVTKGETK